MKSDRKHGEGEPEAILSSDSSRNQFPPFSLWVAINLCTLCACTARDEQWYPEKHALVKCTPGVKLVRLAVSYVTSGFSQENCTCCDRHPFHLFYSAVWQKQYHKMTQGISAEGLSSSPLKPRAHWWILLVCMSAFSKSNEARSCLCVKHTHTVCFFSELI